MVGSVASLRVLGSHFQVPDCQGLVFQGPRSHGPRVSWSWVSWSYMSGFHGLGSQGPGSQDLGSQSLRIPGLGSQVLILDYANDIIARWIHCLTSESKERFLVNNILFGSVGRLVMVEIQFSLTHCSLVLLSIPPENIKKLLGFLMFSGGIEK